MDVKRRRIGCRGFVQGVGFRPTVYRLAVAAGLSGWVLNGPDGVVLEVEGRRFQAGLGVLAQLARAEIRLVAQPPQHLGPLVDLQRHAVQPGDACGDESDAHGSLLLCVVVSDR